MKQIALITVLILSCALNAQEKVFPLRYNPNLYDGYNPMLKAGTAQLDSTFIYEIDTLELPFYDDFAINRFEQYDADFTDPGVTSDWFFELMNASNTAPLPADITLCDSSRARHDTVVVAGGVSTTTEYYPFSEVEIFENNLDFYPIVGQTRILFEECYVLVDSVIDGELDADQDTIFFEPNFTQDSIHLFTKAVDDQERLWVDNFAYHNYTFAVNPYSLGVVTFDGVSENGIPYQFGNESAFGVADYLTSKPINLEGASGFVGISFLFQAQGFGNAPDDNDSLLLEFWDVTNEEWVKAPWFATTNETSLNVWDTAAFVIDAMLYQNGFRIRFKNYASLSGALDHWHIDYVQIEENVLPGWETEPINDLAIMYPVNSLLVDYTHVPWDHYKLTSGNEKMKTTFYQPTFNSSSTNTNVSDGGVRISRNGSTVFEYSIPITGGSDPNSYLVGPYDCDVAVDDAFFFDQSIADDRGIFDIRSHIAETVSEENRDTLNDTTYFQQSFLNYYAYDDGSAEAAYGIEGSGSLMAYQFEAYTGGELAGILMHFVPSVTDFENEIFLLTVWNDIDGEPGDIIYQDDFFESHTPDYSGSREGFKYYTFYNDEYLNADGFLPVGEKFYVGWQNINPPSLNIGLDWNIDNGDRVFRNTSGTWLTSSFDMSLLIRPVFSTSLDYTLSNKPISSNLYEQFINVYPNPANDQFTITGLTGNELIRVFDMSGRMVVSGRQQTRIDIAHLENGVYLIDVRDESGEQVYATKLIKQ